MICSGGPGMFGFCLSLFYLQELDKAWKMVDAANDKEKRDKEAIKSLKDEISKLMEQDKQRVPPAGQEQM